MSDGLVYPTLPGVVYVEWDHKVLSDGTVDWTRGYDVDGPLEADAYRAVYTDNNNNQDVVRSNSYVYSYSIAPLFTGTYWVSASVWIEEFGTNAHSGTFQGSAYDSESQPVVQ